MVDRIKYIINTSVEYFKLDLSPTSPPSTTSNIDDTLIRDFFENDDLTILAVTIQNDFMLNFSHTIPTEQKNCILFYKIPQFSVTPINNTINNNNNTVPFGMLTLEGGLIKSIYNSLVRVYSPHVIKRIEYTPELEKNLENLHSLLGLSLGLPQSGIHTVQDEIYFWTDKSINAITKSDKENAKLCINLIEKLNIQIRELSKSSFKSLNDFIHYTNNILDEIWRLPNNYPQNRMSDLLDIICSEIVEICIDQLNNEDIWNMNSFHITTILNDVQDIIENWLQICDSLTRLFWPNYGVHPWIGEPHISVRAITFCERLNRIKNIKDLIKQITLIFNTNYHNNSNNSIDSDEDIKKSIKLLYAPFKNINIFDTTPFGKKQWQKSVDLFEKYLQPIDEKMALIIKIKLQNHLDNPRQVVHIFNEHNNILKRSAVMELLTPERDYFLQYLNVLIEDLKKSLIQNNKSLSNNGNLTPICCECVGLKIVEHQINEIKNVTHLIEEREGYETINKSINELKIQVDNLLKSNFETWREESIVAVQSGDLTLKDDKPVVEFEKFGRQLMQVTFKPKLITFCQDVHEFENLGFLVPIELRETATHAKKFMSYARRLQQIATFHNTIGDRMIPCQRPIMLKNAVELSRLVQSESVAWNDETSINRYVSMLQDAVSKLSHDNAFLASQHEEAKRTIIKLMNTDLLQHSNVWKEEMRHLRDIIGVLESKGYKNLQVFKLHWDHQLYKVLEYQYLYGLINLNNKLPDINIDIVFRQQQLQFRPSIEEIKSKYFSHLRKFLERPLGFHGLSDESNNLFRIMVERNRHQFGMLYEKGTKIINQICELRDLWLPWVALGCVNLEELCETHLVNSDDWDKHFKSCKHFSQQIAKIQSSEERIDCFVINLSPLRSDIEFISRKYWETLTNSLRSSILKDISILQDYVQVSIQFLQNVALDDFGINEAGEKYEKIMFELPQMTEVLKSVEGKDKCLAGWCKERVSSLSVIQQQWDQLQPLIENHSVVLQRQIEIMKDRLQSQIENVQEEGDKFHIRWESMIHELMANDKEAINLKRFKEMQQNWMTIKTKYEDLIVECKKYNIEINESLTEYIDKLNEETTEQSEQWECFDGYLKEYDEITTEEWAVYRRRPYIFTDFLSKWTSISKQTVNSATLRIRKILENHELILPVLQNLQSDGLTEKHWAKIFSLINQTPKPYHDIHLKDILLDTTILLQSSGEIQNLVRQATSEQIVRQALTELDQWGTVATLKLTTFSDSKGMAISLIKDYKETLNKIGDNQCLLQSAKVSSAFDSFSDQADIWEGRLNSLDAILTSLNQIQRKWIYLDPIFGIGTLKSEEAIFTRIDKDFKYIMKEISNDPRVISVIKISNIKSLIHSLDNHLSKCQNTLTAYITEKRNEFPRFYFLCDDDLLELLGQSTKIEIIQKHIKKLFPGISRLGFVTINESSMSIRTIFSAEGEEINLKNAITICDGNNNSKIAIEKWLNNLVDEIKYTLKCLIENCTKICKDPFTNEHIMEYPIQVLCTSKAITFTRLTEKAIQSMSLEQHRNSVDEEMQIYSSMLMKYSELENNLIQIKLRTLLLDLVHYVTTIELLLKHSVTNLQDWFWLQQIKFYQNHTSANNKNAEITIKMVYTEFEYSYEYLGSLNKLVYTKLTHNCYLTLTQAMHLGLGGNPFGPAGTGKTECVKALGAMLGRLVLVFNCNENVDTTAMGLILSGLARCGAWGCFDEFNRLQESTLSSISMLIQPLQTAIKERNDAVTILDKPIPLNLHCGIFVTLNPAGEEYGGRQNLPSNLQALFRPIVMQQPEPREIATVMLFIEGFRNAKDIGNRVVEIFNLANKILSQQRHYEWGLRELKTVLLACGKLLHTSKHNFNKNDNNRAADDEILITIQALRSNTMSKLTKSDCQRFDTLIEYVFTNTNEITNKIEEISLVETITESFGSLGLLFNQIQLEKCLQLYEQMSKRMGVVVLGPPTSGKTTIISILKQALITSGKTIRTYTISPKSMNRIKLLGKLDPDTRQWYDGVLTTIAVAVNNEPPEITSWIICDGDVDPEWIEALNSVLDDNKLLTLPSGWRIQFGDNVNFLFETHNLLHASPATISRMGIVNLSANDLEASIIINSWLQNQSNDDLKEFIDKYFEKSLNWIENLKDRMTSISRIGLVKCGLINLTDCQTKEEFCVNLLHGLGSTLSQIQKHKFAIKLFEWADVYLPDSSQIELCYYNKLRDIIEIHNTDQQPINEFSKEIDNSLIKTANVKVYSDIIRNFINQSSNNPPFLIIGPSGSGKSLLLENIVTEFTGYQLVMINCSAQLSSNYVLYSLKQNCLVISGIRGREYKPKLTKLILCFKNIDLCNVDSWETCEVIELVLQLINRNGFYTDTMEWINITGLQICATISDEPMAMLSLRYLSIQRILVTGYPNEMELVVILKNQLIPVCNNVQMEKLKTDQIVDILIKLYLNMRKYFTIELRNHYIFTPKMLSLLIRNLVHYTKETFFEGFINECIATFRNRLISMDHVNKFNIMLQKICEESGYKLQENQLYFVPLKGATDIEWIDTVQNNIKICNNEDIVLEITANSYVRSVIANITRALSRSSTNLVLCGRIGQGRQQYLHIACTLLRIKIFPLQSTKGYNIDDFCNDLKMAMQMAAIEDQNIVIHIDHFLIEYCPDILKPIEAILEGSELPELFGDDLETIANPLKNAAQIELYQESITAYFWKRVKSNLHLVVSLENDSDNLIELFNQYPVLYKSTEMICLENINNEMINKYPENVIKIISNSDKLDIPIPIIFSTIFEPNIMDNHIGYSFEWNHSYRRFNQTIKTYYYIYKESLEKITKLLQNLQAGIDKLSSSNNIVNSLKNEAGVQEIALAEKRKLANQSLEMISVTMRNATDQRTDLIELKKLSQENSEKLMERKKAIELELMEVEPILKEASAAVGQIKGEALSEIRSLRAPPEIIRDILEGVLRLMGIRDTSWNSMKSFLAKRGIKEDIRLLDPARITVENCQTVEKLLQSKSESFVLKNAKRASTAAAPLASWVIANVRYSRVCQSIKPLEDEQNQLQKNLEASENEMLALTNGLNDVDVRVKELSNQLNLYTQEAAVLEIKLDEARNTLKSSEVLVEKLSTEYTNWNKQLSELTDDLEKLDIRSFIISYAINYLSHLTFDNRKNKINEMAKNNNLFKINLSKILITEQEKIMWQSLGLTNDVQSMENAALLIKMLNLPFSVTPIPFLIDPLQNAFEWLQKYLQTNELPFEISSQSSERFTYTLELAIRFGKILIIKDCEKIVPPILSVISTIFHTRFNKKSIYVGNKFIDFHENFKIIFITKLNSIKFGAEISPYITCIPFTTTISGLTDQLMSQAILIKQPDLEDKRCKLLQKEGELLKKRLSLQEKLLIELSSAEGDILKNEKLLSTLNEIKESTLSIDRSLSESTNIRNELTKQFENYNDICQKAAYFYIGINHVYKFISVSVFLSLFLKCIKYQDEFNRTNVYAQLVRLTYYMLSRIVAKNDHIELGLNICKNAYPDEIPDKEWETFITNFQSIEDSTTMFTVPNWITKELHTKVITLKTQHAQFYDQLQLDNENVWRQYVSQITNDLPSNVNDVISGFQKILITQILRPDLLIQTIEKCILNQLAITNISIAKPTIEQLFEEMNNFNPILLIATGDSDPSKDIKDYVQQLSKTKTIRYVEISVGEGQSSYANQELRKATTNGYWLCFKNIHLISTQWLIDLNDQLQSMDIANGFCLWLICDSIKRIPESLLIRSIKVLYENPSGLKQKILKLLTQRSEELLSKKSDAKFIKLHVITFILNAVLQERLSYIPHGWSKLYDFGDSDLRAAIDIINWMEISINMKMEWSILRGLCYHIAYGGRIYNNQDTQILMVLLKAFYNDKIMNSNWKPLNFSINIPQSTRIIDYHNAIVQMSDHEKPELLGLSCIKNSSMEILICRNLLKQLRSSYFLSDNHENYEKRIKPILNLWKKLTGNTTIIQTYDHLNKGNDEMTLTDKTPWYTFLQSELIIAGKLFNNIHETLVMLHSGLKNLTIISKENRCVMLEICENHVPLKWRQIWPFSGHKSAIDFLKSVVIRAIEIEQLYKHSQHIDFCDSIHFGNIFNVESYLAALKLTNAKELNVSTCDLVIATDLTKNFVQYKCSKPIVKELMIDGASFKNNEIFLSNNITEKSSNRITSIQITFIPLLTNYNAGINCNDTVKNTIELPFYSSTSRDHHICNIRVPIRDEPEAITLAGVALIVSD